MTYLPSIQNHLKEQLSELCEACFAEHEWLEEGRNFEADTAQHTQIANGANGESVSDGPSE